MDGKINWSVEGEERSPRVRGADVLSTRTRAPTHGRPGWDVTMIDVRAGLSQELASLGEDRESSVVGQERRLSRLGHDVVVDAVEMSLLPQMDEYGRGN